MATPTNSLNQGVLTRLGVGLLMVLWTRATPHGGTLQSNGNLRLTLSVAEVRTCEMDEQVYTFLIRGVAKYENPGTADLTVETHDLFDLLPSAARKTDTLLAGDYDVAIGHERFQDPRLGAR